MRPFLRPRIKYGAGFEGKQKILRNMGSLFIARYLTLALQAQVRSTMALKT